MPDTCSVYGCSNRSNRDIGKRFFRIPKVTVLKGEKSREWSQRRREKWLANLSLNSKGVESPHARVCSDHFVKGCPSKLFEEDDVDWAPTVNLGHPRVQLQAEGEERSDAHGKLKRRHSDATIAQALLELHKHPRVESCTQKPGERKNQEVAVAQDTTKASVMVEQGSQTDVLGCHIDAMEENLHRLKSELDQLRARTLTEEEVQDKGVKHVVKGQYIHTAVGDHASLDKPEECDHSDSCTQGHKPAVKQENCARP